MSPSLLKELTRPFDCPDIRELDLLALRAAFAELMDAAADAAHAAGLEQDDCILERYADVRFQTDGEARTIEVDMLSERNLCIESILARIPRSVPGGVAIVALRLRLLRGGMLDPFGLGSPHA